MAESVAYDYDGGIPGILTATITGAQIGHGYFLGSDGAGNAYDVATSSTLVLTVNPFSPNGDAGDKVLVMVEDDGPDPPGNGYRPFSVEIIKRGTASTGEGNPSDVIATWNPSTGDVTITLTPRGRPTDPFSWYDGGDGYDSSGALSTLNLTMDMSGIDGADILVMEVRQADLSWWDDEAAWIVIPGDPTLHPPGVAGPAPLRADFSGTPLTGFPPLDVNFTDLSTPGDGGAITGWSWDFGDGGTSSTPNPTHTYTTPGAYTAQLTVTNPSGTATKTRTAYVNVSDPGSGNWIEAKCDTADAYVEKNIAFGLPSALNSISRVGTPTTANATSVSLPSGIVAGDILLMSVLRNGSASPPNTAAGWTFLTNRQQNSGGFISWFGLYAKVAVGGDTSGTWTNASALSCSAYRNAQMPNSENPLIGNGTSVTYGGLSVLTPASDWLVAFSMADSGGCNTTPTGLSVPSGFTESATRGIYDSNGPFGSSSFANQNITGQPNQAWATVVIDLQPTFASSDFWFQFDTATLAPTMTAILPDRRSAALVLLDGKNEGNDGINIGNSFFPLANTGWRWRDWWQGQLQGTGSGVTLDAVHTVESHWTPTSGPDSLGRYDGTMSVIVDGNTLHESFGNNTSWIVSLTPGKFGVGGMFAEFEHCERYYLTRIKAGTTRHGTDIFEWDGSATDLSGWDASVGEVSVVSAPIGCRPPGALTMTPSPGCPGTTVRVTGSGFTPGDAITATFDDVEVSFSEATVAGDGRVDGTFVVPCSVCGIYLFSLTTPDETSRAEFRVSCPSFTSTPTSGPPGTVVTVTGACMCPGALDTTLMELCATPLDGVEGFDYACVDIVFDNETVAADGTWTGHYTVPEGAKPGSVYTLRNLSDGSGNPVDLSFSVCERIPGATYDTPQTTAVPALASDFLDPATYFPMSPGDPYRPLNWTETPTDWWLLLRTPGAVSGGYFAHSGTESIPGGTAPGFPEYYPLLAVKFPKDGSALSTYPVGTDLDMMYNFGSNVGGTVGCFDITYPCKCCTEDTPGRTGYWWQRSFWFESYRKTVSNARICSDGTHVWVAAVCAETEENPYNDDYGGVIDQVMVACGCSSTSCLAQLPDSNSQFVDLDLLTSGQTVFKTNQSNGSNVDVNGCGVYGSSSDYLRWIKNGNGTLGLDPREDPESSNGLENSGFHNAYKLVSFAFDGSVFSRIGEDHGKYVSTDSPNRDVGRISVCASPAEPGVMHAAWIEEGAFGVTGHGDVVWDWHEPTIGRRFSLTTWDTTGMTAQSDLLDGTYDRSGFYYRSEGQNQDAGYPPELDFIPSFDLKNDHGSVAMFGCYRNYLFIPEDAGQGVGGRWSIHNADPHVKYWNVSGGSLSLLASLPDILLPTAEDIFVAAEDPIPGDQELLLIADSPSSEQALAMTAPYKDPTLGGNTVYVIIASFYEYSPTTFFHPGGIGVYRIRPNASGGFSYIEGERDVSIAPNVTKGSSGGIPVGSGDFAIEPRNVWAPFPDSYNAGINRLDLGPCDRWWEHLWLPYDFRQIVGGYGYWRYIWASFGGIINVEEGMRGWPIVDTPNDVIYYPGLYTDSTYDGFTLIPASSYKFGILRMPINRDNPCFCTDLVVYPPNVILNVNHAYGRNK